MTLTSDNRSDHYRIAEFISRTNKVVKALYTHVLLICDELDLISGKVFAVDGCKISSNAYKEYSGSFDELEKKKARLDEET